MIDLRLMLVTDSTLCGPRGVVATAARAVAGGVTCVQVREPGAHGREVYELALALQEVLVPHGIPLLVNDHVDVALAAGAAGVHLGQRDLPAPAARRIVPPGFVLGWSVSDAAQAAEVAAWPAGTVDYLGLGPYRATATKPDAAAALGDDGLCDLAGATPVPGVAIGGIDAANARAVLRTGVRGVAVVSAICAAPDPAAAAAALRTAVDGAAA